MLIDRVPTYIVGWLPWEANYEMEICMQVVGRGVLRGSTL